MTLYFLPYLVKFCLHACFPVLDSELFENRADIVSMAFPMTNALLGHILIVNLLCQLASAMGYAAISPSHYAGCVCADVWK